jgi:hypothetical protein
VAKQADFSQNWRSLFDLNQLRKLVDLFFLKQEKENLILIAEPQSRFQTFDYDGKRYSKKEAQSLIDKIEARIEGLSAEIIQNNQSIFAFFYSTAAPFGKSRNIENAYKNHFNLMEYWEGNLKKVQKIITALNYLIASESYLEATDRSKNLEKWDKTLKTILTSILAQPELLNWLWNSQITATRAFIQHNELFFFDEKINTDLIDRMVGILNMFVDFAKAAQNSSLQKIARLQKEILIDAGLLE